MATEKQYVDFTVHVKILCNPVVIESEEEYRRARDKVERRIREQLSSDIWVYIVR